VLGVFPALPGHPLYCDGGSQGQAGGGGGGDGGGGGGAQRGGGGGGEDPRALSKRRTARNTATTDVRVRVRVRVLPSTPPKVYPALCISDTLRRTNPPQDKQKRAVLFCSVLFVK